MTRGRQFVLAILFALTGCAGGGDYELELRHGYFLARVSPGKFCIVTPDRHTVVIPDVKHYRVDDDIVGGDTTRGSYFIIDTRRSAVVQDLSRAEWLRRRTLLGLQDHRLQAPRPAGVMWPWRRD